MASTFVNALGQSSLEKTSDAFLVCDKGGYGEVFLRRIHYDPHGEIIRFKDAHLDGTEHTPVGDVVPYPNAEYGTQTVKPIRDFYMDVSRGKVSGFLGVTIQGHNPDIDTGTDPEVMWTGGPEPGSSAYTFLTTAKELRVRSTSALDTALGTGAQNVTLKLLDDQYVEHTVTVDLDGLTNVVIPEGPYFRVNSMIAGRSTASVGYNEGEIILETDEGAPVRLAHMGVRVGFAQQAIYTVPKDMTFLLASVRGSFKRTGASEYAQFELRVWRPGLVWLLRATLNVSSQGANTAVDPVVPGMVPEKTDMVAYCSEVSVNNFPAYFSWQGVLASNVLDDAVIGYP